MKTLLRRAALGLLASLLCATLAQAQTKPVFAPGAFVPPQAAAFADGSGNAVTVNDANGLPVRCMFGCGGGGGGGGDASAANQVITNTRIGDVTSPGVGSTNYQLGQIYTRLNNPFQAGGSIGNTVFGATQSGTWNLTNITGTVSLPTGAATSALQSTGNTSLGSIDTKLSSQATAANQTTGNASLASLVTALAPTPASAVTGTFVATGNGSTFTPAAGKAFNLTIYATGGTAPGSSLNATVYLARSTDGGTVYLPMTAAGTGIFSFTTLANESLYESQTGVIYRLVCSSYASGTVNYRFSQ